MAIRIVVVGMGPRGQDWLREVQTAPGYELAGRVDIDQAALKQASRKGASPMPPIRRRAYLDQPAGVT